MTPSNYLSLAGIGQIRGGPRITTMVPEALGTLPALQWGPLRPDPSGPSCRSRQIRGRPFQTDVIRALCGVPERAQEVAG